MGYCVPFRVCQFSKKDVGNNLVHVPTKQGGLPTSEGVLPTSEGVINAKQAILREIKGLFCAYQHVANTKFAPKCAFCPQNALFLSTSAVPTLTQPICPPTGRSLGASGLWIFGPKSSVGCVVPDGNFLWYWGMENEILLFGSGATDIFTGVDSDAAF
jgi:hypothetical protein